MRIVSLLLILLFLPGCVTARYKHDPKTGHTEISVTSFFRSQANYRGSYDPKSGAFSFGAQGAQVEDLPPEVKDLLLRRFLNPGG